MNISLEDHQHPNPKPYTAMIFVAGKLLSDHIQIGFDLHVFLFSLNAYFQRKTLLWILFIKCG